MVDAAAHSHRFIAEGEASSESGDYRGDTWEGPGGDRMPEPPGDLAVLGFSAGPLEGVRQFVIAQAGDALGRTELSDLLMAVTEVAGNSVLHGGGAGTLRVWSTWAGVVCETRDRGWIRQPLAGRTRPAPEQESGRGLWIVNQVCDLFQLRSSPAGTVARLHMHRRPT